MTRIIKRYGSRKLYDTTESRYVLLEDIAEWIRTGEDIAVVDNKTGEDVTAQTLTQVISEEGRKKESFLSSELLHDLIRAGESAVNNRVRQFQEGMESLVKRGIGRFVPISSARDEMAQLRRRLEELEAAVSHAEKAQEEASSPDPAPAAASEDTSEEASKEEATVAVKKTTRKPAAKKTTTRKPAAKKTTTTRKPAAKKPGSRKTATRKSATTNNTKAEAPQAPAAETKA